MASAIDPTKPSGTTAYWAMAGGSNKRSAAFAADVRANFAAAASEITALQAGGGGGGGGGVSIQSVLVHLTPAQLVLSTGNVPVVAAPGANQMIVPIRSIYVYKFGTTPYAGGGANMLFFGTNLSGNTAADGGDNTMGALTRSAAWIAGGNTGPFLSDAVNAPIVWGFASDIGAQPYSGGDGTIDITFLYTVIPV